jgi:hypothetical protein
MTFGNFCLTVINKLPVPKTDYWQSSEYKISINFEIACLPAKKMRLRAFCHLHLAAEASAKADKETQKT